MNETMQSFKEAIELCDKLRYKFPLVKATPNQLVLYNVFTRAKRELTSHLATIEDALGIYMKDKNEG